MASKTYRLGSAPMIHTPGIINYLRRAVSREQAHNIFDAAFPNLPSDVFHHIYNGSYTVEDETVVVTIDVTTN